MSVWLPLAALALLWWGLGPWVPMVALLVLVVPRVGPWVRGRLGERLRPQRPWRTAGRAGLAIAVAVGLVALVPDGWLPVPQAPGRWVTPAYVGRPALPAPLTASRPDRHPHLAAPAAEDAPLGPVGIDPDVDTGWYGLVDCSDPALERHGRLVTVCRDAGGAALHVVDPGSLRPLARKDLADPDGEEGGGCDAAPFFLDARDRAVVATADRRVLAIRTSDAEGEADLSTDHVWDLAAAVPEDDCVVTLAPDWSGRLWFATRHGLVGTLGPGTGRVRTHDLGEQVAAPITVDSGGAHVVTDTALHRLTAGPDGRPAVAWRTAYDDGDEEDPWAPAPVLLEGGLVAIADRAEPRPHLVVLDRATGSERCRVEVLDDGARVGTTVSVGSGVVVAGADGPAGLLSAVPLLRGGSGLARVDVPPPGAGDGCRVRWTSDAPAPAAVGAVSWDHGLVHAWTTRRSWWGVAGWYLTALDARTGRTAFSVRAGTGPLMSPAGAAMLLAPDGTAYAATRGGLVRVRDRT